MIIENFLPDADKNNIKNEQGNSEEETIRTNFKVSWRGRRPKTNMKMTLIMRYVGCYYDDHYESMIIMMKA